MEQENTNDLQNTQLEESAIKLKDLIENGILKSLINAIKENIITEQDRKELILITDLLYNELYGDNETLDQMKVREVLDEQIALFANDEIRNEN